MNTPVHSINIDFSHSSEAAEVRELVTVRLNWLSPSSPEFQFLHRIKKNLDEAIELLESLEG